MKSIRQEKNWGKEKSKSKVKVTKGVFFSMHLNVAKTENSVDPRRQGRSGTKVLLSLDNTGDAASNGFPEG
jgi:hypothetical protein